MAAERRFCGRDPHAAIMLIVYRRMLGNNKPTRRSWDTVNLRSGQTPRSMRSVAAQPGARRCEGGSCTRADWLASDGFDYEFYVAVNGDLCGFSREQAENHWLDRGRSEGRRCSGREEHLRDAGFDHEFYAMTNADLRDMSRREAENHWLKYGKREGRAPGPCSSSRKGPDPSKGCRGPIRRVCVVQPIFCADDAGLRAFLDSVHSQIALIDDVCDFFYGGWCRESRYWTEIDAAVRAMKPRKYIKQPRNYGKAYNVNMLLDDIPAGDYDVMLTLDSDIILKDNQHYFDTVGTLFQNIENFAICAPAMEQQDCHHAMPLTSCIAGTTVLHPHRAANGGIAGGCLFINFSMWKKVGGYKVMGVYASEDAHILHDMDLVDGFCCIAPGIAVIHPFCASGAEYARWKADTCQRLNAETWEGASDDKLEAEIDLCDELWERLSSQS